MKILKTTLIALAALIAIPLIAALFITTEFSLEREVTINKPKQAVFDYIKRLRNHVHYSAWAALDPNMKTSYRGMDGTTGSVAAWESENRNVGKGEQEIKNIVEGQRIDIEIRFTEPFQSTDPAYMITEAVSDRQTRLKLGYHGKMAYPTNLMTSFIKQGIGRDMETSLANIKAILEKE